MAEKLKNFGTNYADKKDVRERAQKFVIGEVQNIKNARSYLENKWTMLERLWRGDPISRYYPASHTTHVPEPFKAVESIVPRLKEGLFPSSEWFRVALMADEQGDPECIQILLNEQMKDGKFDYNFTMYLRNLCVYGTAIAKAPYISDEARFFFRERVKEEILMGPEPVSRENGKTVKKEYKVDKSRTEFSTIEIFDFYCDPRYDDPAKAPGCGDVSRHSREYVREMVAQGIYTGITDKEITELGTSQGKAVVAGSDLRYNAIDASAMKRNPEDDIQVMEWWGLFDLEGDGKRVECVITVLNDKHCVRIQENKLWHRRRPYLLSQYITVQGQLYGLGVIEPIVWLVQDLNDMRNTVNSASALVANPMLKVGDDANVEDEVITASPGKILRCSNIEQVQVLAEPDVTGVARMSEQVTRQDIVEVTGSTRIGMGGQDANSETATAVYTRSRESNVRLKEVIKNIARDALEPYLEMAHYNNHQFMDETRVVVISGDAKNYLHFKVTPEKLAGAARFDILLAPQIELLGVRGQQMMMFLERVSANPILASATNPPGMLKTIWSDMFGDRDIDKAFPPMADEEDIAQIEENMVMREGVEVKVRKHHNHKEHLRVLNIYMSMPQFQYLRPDIQGLFIAHANNHDMWIKREEQKPQPPMPGMMPGMGGGGAMGMPQGMEPMMAPGVTARDTEAEQMGMALADEARARVQGG